MPRFLIYARKSTESEDRQALSIDAQVKELSEYAARNELTIGETYTESQSAKRSGRPVFGAMVRRLKRGGFAGILCWKLDRLTRNMADAAVVSELLEDGHVQEIHTPSQVFRNTSTDKFMSGLDFLVARKYIDDLSENVRRGLRFKVSKGWRPGKAPLGYLNSVHPTTGERSITPDPERFDLLRDAWELMLSGNFSIPQIVKVANEKWGFRTRQCRRSDAGPLKKSVLHAIFRNRFYAGEFFFGGELCKGRHQPMVTIREFERVQSLLDGNGTTRPKDDYFFAYRGLIVCGECGGAVTAENKYKWIRSLGVRKQYKYYHCTHTRDAPCRQGSITEAELSARIEEYLGTITIPEAYLSWLSRYVDSVRMSQVQSDANSRDRIKKSITAIDTRLKNLLQLRISPNNQSGDFLDDETYLQERNRLTAQKYRLEESLAQAKAKEQHIISTIKESFSFASQAGKSFKWGDEQHKRDILATLGSNHVLIDRQLRIRPKPPFDSFPGIGLALSRAVSIRTGKLSQSQGHSGRESAETFPKLGYLDDVRTKVIEIFENLRKVII